MQARSVLRWAACSALLLWLAAAAPTLADDVTSGTPPGGGKAGAPRVSLDTEKLDQAGQAIGRQVNRLGVRASAHVGGWITHKVFLDISWLKLLTCLALLFAVLLVERLLAWIVGLKLKKPPADNGRTRWDLLLLECLTRPLSLFIWVYGTYWALSPLYGHFATPDGRNLVHTVARGAAEIGGAFAVFWLIYRFVAVIDQRLRAWAKTTQSNIDDVLVPIIGKTLRVFIILIGALVILQNLTGLEIGPLLASLGIGGIAVALAAKDTIANFFGTLTILFDKPFQVGERILTGGLDGVVEEVGFRSTRIRTLTGHLVSVPNEKIVNSDIENIARRPHIRWLTNIGITYDTPPEKVEQAVALVQEALADHEGMHPDFPPRVYFNAFNDWSLNILVIAWYHPPNYWDYQAWLQRTCLEIMRRFGTAGIDFAFPSRTVYVAGDDKRRVNLNLYQAGAPTAGETFSG